MDSKDSKDSMEAQDSQAPFHRLDPRRLYPYALDPPPSAEALRRRYARRAVTIALPLEGAVALMLVALGRSLVILGLVDGLDEVCSCLGLFVGAGLTFLAWSSGSAYGQLRYQRDLRAWRERHPLARE